MPRTDTVVPEDEAVSLAAPVFAHSWPTLHPGAVRRRVKPGRGAGAKVAPVFAEQFRTALGGKLGVPLG